MKLEFTNEQLVTINKALMNLPYYEAAPLINDINQQIKKKQNEDAENKDDQ